jgi:hypothetical protein
VEQIVDLFNRQDPEMLADTVHQRVIPEEHLHQRSINQLEEEEDLVDLELPVNQHLGDLEDLVLFLH